MYRYGFSSSAANLRNRIEEKRVKSQGNLKRFGIIKCLFTLYFKVLFMNEQNQQTLETLQDIKRMMERSSRFISLSGLSGIAAGICALIGAWFANKESRHYYSSYDYRGHFAGEDFQQLKFRLLVIAWLVWLLHFFLPFILPGEKQNIINYGYGI